MKPTHPLQQRIRARLIETQEQNSDILPAWLRSFLRATSGGSDWTATFVRGMIWKYRWLLLAAFIANLGSGIAEAATLGVLSLALTRMSATLSNTPIDTSGTTNAIIMQIANFFGTQEPIFILIILVVLFQILRSILDYSGQAAAIYLRVWLEGDLQGRIFRQLMYTRYQQMADNRLGNMVSYNTQVNEIGLMLQSLNSAVNELVITLAYVALLFWLSWQFTIIAVFSLLLLSAGIRGLRESIRRSGIGFLNISVHLNERLLEYLNGLRLVHIFVREDNAIKEVDGIIKSGYQPRRLGLLRRASITPIVQSLTIIAVALMVGIGYWFINENSIAEAGKLATYVLIIYRMTPRISNFNNQWGFVAGQWPYAVRIAQLLDPAGKEREYVPGKAVEKIEQGIKFRGVSLRYPGSERDAVSNLHFSVQKGKMVALVGASGSGKSSIINLMLNIYRPTGGQILIDDIDLQACDLASWRRLIGVVDQDTLIFSNTIAENIRFGKPNATDAEVAAAAKVAYADLFIASLPQEYQTEVGDRGHKLSGGQRQRIAIARAVVSDPALLLFDEATSALDSQSERLIQESLEELRKERTVVVIAHRLSTIVKADQIIVMDNGQIMEQGTHQELLAQGGRYAAMWLLQADSA